MKIVFIYPTIGNMVEYQFGIASLSSVLKKNNHKVNLIRINKNISPRKIAKLVKNMKPNIVAFSFVSNHFIYVKKYAREIKKQIKIPIVAGGIHATTDPETVISDKNIDYVCVGEGEYPLSELINAITQKKDTTKIKNIWAKKNGKIIRNELRELIQNLDNLPFGDRELFYGTNETSSKKIRELFMMAGRGCPYDCTYCCNHLLRKIYKNCGKYVRMRSVDNVISEIKESRKNYDFETVTFHDDTFTLFKNWLIEFAKKYPKEINIPFSCNARAENITNDLVATLKKAGCTHIGIGIESGNEELRSKILKRRMSNQQIINAFEIVKKHNLGVGTFYLIGFPNETEEMINDTIKLHKIVKPTGGYPVSIFYPFPNTELYEITKKQGLLTKKIKDTFGAGFIGSGGYSTLNFSKKHHKIIRKKYWKLLDMEYKENDFGYKWVKAHHPIHIYFMYWLLSVFIGPSKAFMFMLSFKKPFIKQYDIT